MGKVTITDVARLAGVSEMTVSRTMREKGYVSDHTRKKVLAAVDELHFTLSKSASSLASGKSMHVRLLVAGPLNSWFNSSVLQGAYEVLTPEGYDITPAFITNKHDLVNFLDTLAYENNFDSLIIASFEIDSSFESALKTYGSPIIGINNSSSTGFDASVSIDDIESISKVVRLLHSLGRNHLAYVGDLIPPDLGYSVSLRSAGFHKAATALGYSEKNLYSTPPSKENLALSPLQRAQKIVSQLLSLPVMPNGICAENDSLAVLVMNELKRHGITVPEGVSITGFDDSNLAQSVGLTTIHQDPIHLGKIAAQKALALMKHETLHEPHSVEGTELVLRDTTTSLAS